MPTQNFLTRLRDTVQKFLPKAPQSDPNEAVTIATLAPLMRPQAELFRVRLEEEGIMCFITGEQAVHADAIRLRVRRADADQARAILEEMENS